uniref:NADH-ubiquinone oxidoreductase chain 6 n=1 Tax=Petrobius brevistylis TaxID=50562 RepID=Q2TCQ6_9INSE|nr:NADH dehydrogenase subunit 6 [Petrobius brevistylis]AAX39860.1 NADH dehydrogenase subunit 6 [Petrobius brevistylis]
MLLYSLSLMSMMMNIIMISVNHPIAMGLILMLQTTLVAIYTGTLYMSFWFSYILFLIFLGGLLVLFIYVASLATNEMFNISPKLLITTTFMIIMGGLLISQMDYLLLPTKIYNSESCLTQMKMNDITHDSISKFYSFEIMPITIILIMYLFLTLIVAVKVTKIHQGPLRKLV